MNASALHLDVARELEKALHGHSSGASFLNCAPALEAVQNSWDLEAIFLFTCPDESNPESFEIYNHTSQKPTLFTTVKLDVDSSEFIRSFADKAVLQWTELRRLAYNRDRLWELFWQSMVLGPYPGPWEISAVTLRRQPHREFAGLLVMVRDKSTPWQGPEGDAFAEALKLLAHQFYVSERLAFTQAELTEERGVAGANLFERMLSRSRGDFAHGVFAKLQLIGLLVNNAQDDLRQNNRPPVAEALKSIDGVKAEIHRLIKDVLSLDGGSLKTGRPSNPTDWVNVRASVAMVEQSLGCLAETTSKTIAVRINPPADFPMHKKDFDEVLENLVHNAIKYSGDAEKIKITLSHSARKSMVDVTSIGVVIPKTDWNRIFERGYRTREAAMVTMNALGIGLYQARRLAENAGASLFVQSSEPLEGKQVRVADRTFAAYRNKFRLLATR